MGRSQKRSQKMQSGGSALASAGAAGISGAAAGAASGIAGAANSIASKALAIGGRFTKPLVAILVVAVIAVSLYGPAQQYYTQMRDTEYLQAEHNVVSAQGDALRSEIAYLSTDEGIQDRAREELGYVMDDETAGAVKGANLTGVEERDSRPNLKAYEVDMPNQWFNPMLDALFGWNANI